MRKGISVAILLLATIAVLLLTWLLMPLERPPPPSRPGSAASRGYALPSMRVLPALLLIAFAGCNGSNSEPAGDSEGVCPIENAAASIDVRGTFHYEGDFPYVLTGTITFEQNGDVVTVTNTTYDNANDRALEGTATPYRATGSTSCSFPSTGTRTTRRR
ncbi:MAG: hypothetical protein ACYTGV_00275 [Planctomycetota bacterium]|jgi:hypothetical protein